MAVNLEREARRVIRDEIAPFAIHGVKVSFSAAKKNGMVWASLEAFGKKSRLKFRSVQTAQRDSLRLVARDCRRALAEIGCSAEALEARRLGSLGQKIREAEKEKGVELPKSPPQLTPETLAGDLATIIQSSVQQQEGKMDDLGTAATHEHGPNGSSAGTAVGPKRMQFTQAALIACAMLLGRHGRKKDGFWLYDENHSDTSIANMLATKGHKYATPEMVAYYRKGAGKAEFGKMQSERPTRASPGKGGLNGALARIDALEHRVRALEQLII